MQFNIQDYEVKAIANKLHFNVTTNGDAAIVNYALMNGETVVKRGELPISLADMAIIAKTPIDLQELNTFLAGHGVVVTSQIMQSNETEGS